jgi:hypothetical protein
MNLIYPEAHWTSLSNEVKSAFRRGWERGGGPLPTPLTETYQAASELTYRAGGELESDYEPAGLVGDESDSVLDDDRPPKEFDPDRLVDPIEHRRSTRRGLSPGVRVGIAVGFVGSLVVGGLILSSGSDSDESVTAPEPQAQSEESAEPTPTQPPVTVRDDPTVTVEDEPSIAPDEAPAVAVDEPAASAGPPDPVDQLAVLETAVFVDPEGDVLIVAEFAAPWGPPSSAAAWNMSVNVGIADAGQTYRTDWSLADGKSRGVGYTFVDDRAVSSVDGEMWTTPEGRLVVKLPGSSPTGGLAATDMGPDAVVRWAAQLILEEGGETQRWNGQSPVGEINQLTEPTPPGAQPIETDFGPVTLVIPGS